MTAAGVTVTQLAFYQLFTFQNWLFT